jgi:hypothetical protein
MPDLSIPEDFPVSKLVAQELTQVCIGTHHVRLNFYRLKDPAAGPPPWQPGASIDVEAGFELRQAGVAPHIASNENLGSQAGCLTSLLAQSIGSVERLPENELLLVFLNGAELQLFTDPSGYESYHLHIEGQSVDVTAPSRAP